MSWGGSEKSIGFNSTFRSVCSDRRLEKAGLKLILSFFLTFEGLAGKTFIPYEPTYGKSFKRGTVVAILVDSKEVLLSGGESIGYDYLIIGTGSQGGFPGNVEGGEDTDVYVSKYTGMLQKVGIYNSGCYTRICLLIFLIVLNLKKNSSKFPFRRL